MLYMHDKITFIVAVTSDPGKSLLALYIIIIPRSISLNYIVIHFLQTVESPISHTKCHTYHRWCTTVSMFSRFYVAD